MTRSASSLTPAIPAPKKSFPRSGARVASLPFLYHHRHHVPDKRLANELQSPIFIYSSTLLSFHSGGDLSRHSIAGILSMGQAFLI